MVASIADGRSSATVMADEEKAVTLPTIPKDEPIEEFPPPRKVVLIMLAVYLSMFLVALVIPASRISFGRSLQKN